MNPIEKNIEITENKLENLEREVNSDAHLKRIKNGFDFLYEYIENKGKKIKILDIGCRNGNLLNLFLKKGFYNLYGVDISQKALDVVDKRIKTFLSDAHKLPFDDDIFNVVILTHTLEHCEHPEIVIKEIYRVMVNKGVLFIEVPLETKENFNTGHFTHFEEAQDLFKILPMFKAKKYFEDYKIKKGDNEGGKKRRWFRVILRKF